MCKIITHCSTEPRRKEPRSTPGETFEDRQFTSSLQGDLARKPDSRAEDFALGLLAAALIFVALFWRLGAPSFWDPDEAHYAQTTQEMVASGDWLAPYYNDQPFFDKPVLFHQFQGLAMRTSASPEFAARIVPAVAALGLVGITLWFGIATISTDAAIVAALMLAASPALFALARYAILDTLFTFFTFGAASCLAVAAARDRPRLQWPGYVLLGLGVLTKGTDCSRVLCGLAFLIAIACSADLRRRLLRLHWAIGLLVTTTLALPWFIYMYLRFRQDFVNGYVLDENFRLFATSRFANQPGFWFYFQILAAGLLPWTGLLIGRLVDDVRALRRGENRSTQSKSCCWPGQRPLSASLRGPPSSWITTCFRPRRL